MIKIDGEWLTPEKYYILGMMTFIIFIVVMTIFDKWNNKK